MAKYKQFSMVILVCYLLTLTIGGHSYWHASYDSRHQQNLIHLDHFTSQLSSQLEKYAYLPQLLSKDSELIDALTSPRNSAQLDITNRYLQNVNDIIGASDTYLLDKIGTTIASNNWNTETSFIGRNFAFRPYFQQAISGKRGQYFALGSTSGKRGFYYAYPVVFAAEILGVIVVKTELSDIEQYWSSTQSTFIGVDTDGVIFMSSNSQWLYQSLISLPQVTLDSIKDSRRYLDKKIGSLNFSNDHINATGTIEKKQPTSSERQYLFHRQYLSAKKKLDIQPLEIRVLMPITHIFWDLFRFLTMVTLVYSLIFASWLLIRNRRIRQRQISQIEMEAKQKLEFQVMERTAELQMEIHEREKTETILRKTQQELIQAAKLAVLGQMSASISHELNNPLAAIRSFSENGKRFLDKGQPDRTIDNLTRISALTDRIAKISQQLKSFARKTSSDDLVNAQIYPIILSSIELLKPQFRTKQIQIATHIEHEQLAAKVNVIQLEQVLVNLFTNAIDELAHLDEHHANGKQDHKRRVEITLCEKENDILIYIDDTGRGLEKQASPQLFEPFYTTKKNGLGLGLSISLQIMQAMNGNLTSAPSPLGGARFIVTLHQSPDKASNC